MLWVSPTGAVPASLVAALDRRRIGAVVVREPADVLLELARTRGGGSLSPTESTEDPTQARSPVDPAADSLIVIEPDHQPRLTELTAVLHRYHPAVCCWSYRSRRDGAGPWLESLDPAAAALSDVDETPATASSPQHQSGTEHRPPVLSPPTAAAASAPTPADLPADAPPAVRPPATSSPRAYPPADHPPAASDQPAPADPPRRRQRLAALAVQVPALPRHEGPLVTEAELAMLLGGSDGPD